MNLSFIESLLDKVVKPDRVEIKLLDRKFLLIQSAENTNDTIGWFHINSQALENEFEANNLSWCYVFETAPKQAPCITCLPGKIYPKKKLKHSWRMVRKHFQKGVRYIMKIFLSRRLTLINTIIAGRFWSKNYSGRQAKYLEFTNHKNNEIWLRNM